VRFAGGTDEDFGASRRVGHRGYAFRRWLKVEGQRFSAEG
jgi:hypothetical protein